MAGVARRDCTARKSSATSRLQYVIILFSMSAADSLKLNKAALTVVSLADQSDDREYWHAKSPYERLQAVETLRQLNYGYRQSTTRLQRVLEVAQRASS